MAYEFKLRRRVEFAETDMAGIVHFGVFYVWMEQTEHAFYRSLGFSVVDRESENPVGWPRVSASCDFRRPLRYEDEFEIHLIVREKRSRSIRYEFIFRGPGDSEEELARGRMSVVTVAGDPAVGMRAVPIPVAIAEKIDQAPEDLEPGEDKR